MGWPQSRGFTIMSNLKFLAALATLAFGVLTMPGHAATLSIPRPTINVPKIPAVNATAGLTAKTTITRVGKYVEDTTIYTNKAGKVVMAVSSIAPATSGKPVSSAGSSVGSSSLSSTHYPSTGHNTQNSHQAHQAQNSTNSTQAQQAHQGLNCTFSAHRLGLC
jgi:hypothetical protein